MELITKEQIQSSIEVEKEEFFSIIQDLIENPAVQEMKNFNQHCNTSCYEHCLDVSYHSFLLCKKLGLDYRAAARGGMLHDLFLYNWRKEYRDIELSGLHAFVHPKIALKNSLKEFFLTKKEQDIIVKHMWPVTFFHFPRYIESFIITFVDKYSATKEIYEYYSNYLHQKKAYRYAYVFLCFMLFRVF